MNIRLTVITLLITFYGALVFASDIKLDTNAVEAPAVFSIKMTGMANQIDVDKEVQITPSDIDPEIMEFLNANPQLKIESLELIESPRITKSNNPEPVIAETTEMPIVEPILSHTKIKKIIYPEIKIFPSADAEIPTPNTTDIKTFATVHPVKHRKTPSELLANSIKRITNFLQDSGALKLDEILYFVDNELSGHFDFNHMTRLVLGGTIRQLNQYQIQHLQNRIKEMFIETLANNLVNYSFTKRPIHFLPPQLNSLGTKIIIRAIVYHPRGYSNRLAFKFHPTSKGWKIYDVIANGQSAIIAYRAKIRRYIRYGGI